MTADRLFCRRRRELSNFALSRLYVDDDPLFSPFTRRYRTFLPRAIT